MPPHCSQHLSSLRVLCALVALVVLAGCSPARGLLTLEDHAAPNWGLALTITPSSTVVGSAGTVVDLRLDRKGYLTLLQLGTDGQLDVVFPNAQDADNQLAAGAHRLPRPHWQLRAKGPAGHGRLIAVVTREALRADDVCSALERGAWHELGSDYGLAVARYRETE